jgi:hypothetical protein
MHVGSSDSKPKELYRDGLVFWKLTVAFGVGREANGLTA